MIAFTRSLQMILLYELAKGKHCLNRDNHKYYNYIMFVDNYLESKIKDDFRLDQECSLPETEVESSILKALVSDQPLLFQLLVP